MAAGDRTQGERLADDAIEEVMEQRASYSLCDDGTAVWMCLPVGPGQPARVSVHRAGTEPADAKSWEIVEHDDGSISLAPSILLHAGAELPSWHGYLEHGVWREV